MTAEQTHSERPLRQEKATIATGGIDLEKTDVSRKKCWHTDCPKGYREWHSWAEKKERRHTQIRCPVCSLWAIWIRRSKGEPDYGGESELSNENDKEK